MSIRFQADNDLKRIIVDATLRREPRIDFKTAHAARLDELDDEAVLRPAASQARILVSHDKRTMPKALASFIASGGTSPGVILVIPQNASIREVVEALILIWADDKSKRLEQSDRQNPVLIAGAVRSMRERPARQLHLSLVTRNRHQRE